MKTTSNFYADMQNLLDQMGETILFLSLEKTKEEERTELYKQANELLRQARETLKNNLALELNEDF